MVHTVGYPFSRPSGDHWPVVFAVAGGQDPSTKSLFVYVAEFNVVSVAIESFCHDNAEDLNSAVGGYRCYFFRASAYRDSAKVSLGPPAVAMVGFGYFESESPLSRWGSVPLATQRSCHRYHRPRQSIQSLETSRLEDYGPMSGPTNGDHYRLG